MEGHLGAGLYRLDDLDAGSGYDVTLSWAVDVYGLRTSVRPQDVRSEPSPLRDANTAADSRIPSDDPGVGALAVAIAGGETNHYLRARMVYDWMLANLEWRERLQGDVIFAMETRSVDSFLASVLYSALLRSLGVPTRPVAGVLVSDGKDTLVHHWAEFWLDGLGWIPADPTMGAGAVPAAFAFDGEAYGSDSADFFFGNLDSGRIAFSRGYSEIPRMDPRGRTVTHVRSYALQTIWEESSGGLEAYSSLWGNVIITGMGVH